MMDWLPTISYATQRGILQLVTGLCCVGFCQSMGAHAWRRRNGVMWPIPWHGLVSIWIGAVAWSYLAHGVKWLADGDAARFDSWPMVAPLYVVCVMSVWAFWRWMRVERKKDGS
ncbi:MAG: hypothetical protein MOGMAGMI_01858 [Candidatus Omnitrophica bacterium]|nr:hypothetical protein [Candidatus Omnitrophota bacterium]